MEQIAILIPCYNEEKSIVKVINDFHKELPEAKIYVYDNNSTDDTYNVAKNTGLAEVRHEYNQGKGNVVRRMFREIDADIYVMVDGDDTYPANAVSLLIEPIKNGKADMTIGDRLTNGTYKSENKRLFHNFGNNLVKRIINDIFNKKLKDIMSGYRAFSKTFVKNMPVLSEGFEIETEMTLFALNRRFRIEEIDITYKDRNEDSTSKVNTLVDGFKILKTIFCMYKDYKPLSFFSLIGLFWLIVAVTIFIPIFLDFLQTGYVPKIPSLIGASVMGMVSVLFFSIGILLDTIVKHHKETNELLLLKNFKTKE